MKLDAARSQWLMVEEKWLTAKLELMLYQGTALTVLFSCFGKHFRHFKWTVWGMGEKASNFVNPETWLQLEKLHPCISFLIPIYMCMGGTKYMFQSQKAGAWGPSVPLGSRDNTLWWGPGGKSPEADKSFQTTTHTHTQTHRAKITLRMHSNWILCSIFVLFRSTDPY